MINIICIGEYDCLGRFNTKQWQEVLNGLSHICNNIIIYTKQNVSNIQKQFKRYSDIQELQGPDSSMKVNAYRINITNKMIWDLILNANFSIDSKDSISHLYFFNDERCVASLEIEDYENYILLELSSKELDMISQYLYSLQENQSICSRHKDDIDMLVDGATWIAMGISRD